MVAGGISDAYQPTKDFVNHIKSARPCWEATQHEARKVDQYAEHARQIYEQQGVPAHTYKAIHSNGFAQGVAFQVRNEEPNRPEFGGKVMFSQGKSNRRRLDIHRAHELAYKDHEHNQRMWDAQLQDQKTRSSQPISPPPSYQQQSMSNPYLPATLHRHIHTRRWVEGLKREHNTGMDTHLFKARIG
ncbi:uncharacterized protein LY89DRAFT_688680 [Mollisia scopiformis]|uniref:Uncharacterized protein n=1 Tax=Mollisia scopiformis TaxID=149040 RepID=A0A194WTW7_MOLSC|nr:uncharacterized protein LY89DRAFT_688680 [Mollisia scopiformis]KUJ11408.1 hypothetical protein LY89DRAFT_688680 [Mollisia scopiformis]